LQPLLRRGKKGNKERGEVKAKKESSLKEMKRRPDGYFLEIPNGK